MIGATKNNSHAYQQKIYMPFIIIMTMPDPSHTLVNLILTNVATVSKLFCGVKRSRDGTSILRVFQNLVRNSDAIMLSTPYLMREKVIIVELV